MSANRFSLKLFFIFILLLVVGGVQVISYKAKWLANEEMLEAFYREMGFVSKSSGIGSIDIYDLHFAPKPSVVERDEIRRAFYWNSSEEFIYKTQKFWVQINIKEHSREVFDSYVPKQKGMQRSLNIDEVYEGFYKFPVKEGVLLSSAYRSLSFSQDITGVSTAHRYGGLYFKDDAGVVFVLIKGGDVIQVTPSPNGCAAVFLWRRSTVQRVEGDGNYGDYHVGVFSLCK